MNEILDYLQQLLADLFGRKPSGELDPSDPCNAPACVDAKNNLNSARAGFNGICYILQRVGDIMAILVAVISIPPWVFIALAVIAIFIGGPVGILLGLLIAAYVLSYIMIPVVVKVAEKLAALLSEKREEVTAALRNVVLLCPVSCQGDLSIPTC